MADLTAQTSEGTLPELVRSMLEHLRNLCLKGPSTLKDGDYAMIWHALSTAGNKLVETIENLRFDRPAQWESGDEASIRQFGTLSVPQGKEHLRVVIRELASLGTKWHASSASASISTQRFDPNRVPRLVEFEAVVEDGKVEDLNKADIGEGVEKDLTAPNVIMTEEVFQPSPRDPVLPSIETHTTINSFKTPTVPRPADYKTPPRGPSFSPITPPQGIAETKSNSNSNNDSSSTAPSYPPLQYPDDERFRTYLSTINFDDDDDDMHSMFEVPTPTDVPNDTSPPAQLASHSDPATAAPTEQDDYMASVHRILENIMSLVVLLQPVPAQYTSREE